MKKSLALISLCCFVLASGIFTSSAYAEKKNILAVVDFSLANVELESSKDITAAFRQGLATNTNLDILPWEKVEGAFDKIDPMLQLKLDQVDCTNSACGVRVGRELGANKTLLGSINKSDGRYVITAKLINLEKRDVEFIASQEGTNVKELKKLAKQLGEKVASWMPKAGQTEEQAKAIRIKQQHDEELAREKAVKAERKKLSQRKAGTCPEGMVLIPASGKVKEFCIDKYEFPNKKGTRPRVKMEWFGAKEECAAQGKRLCTSDEWTRACSGPSGNKYPYGNEYVASKCNTKDSGKGGRIMPSGDCTECVSAEGVYDLSGNAVEWTADWDDQDLKTKVTKGGSFRGKPKYASCESMKGSIVLIRRKDNGFRCCK